MDTPNYKTYWIRGDQYPQQSHEGNSHHTNQVAENSHQSSSNPEYENEQNFIPVIQNRGRNFKRKYSRQYNHPICPFLRNSYCPSERCVYFHPKSYTSRINQSENNNPYQYNSNRRYSYREGQTLHNQQQSKREITCKFFLQNRCLYGNSCFYKHPRLTQHP